ncbi:MAG: TM0996/MTH895 family glutaredoxin-like protein [Desulfobacteraceae bacterium]|nr:MAG: TM0996/MTH895 family glutaredoxin-like protein [Desulfobacteraceae bacterium]
MKIEVLGTGCAKCDTTEKIAKEAVSRTGVDARVVKVSDRMEIAKSGVLMTPALLIDGQVKVVGKIPDIEDVISWISEMKEEG